LGFGGSLSDLHANSIISRQSYLIDTLLEASEIFIKRANLL